MSIPPLPEGAVFALIAPSARLDSGLTDKGVALLQSLGYKTISLPNLKDDVQGYGGSVASRVQAIHWAFSESGADAVLCARGGYGAIQLLEHIDYKLIRSNAKPFIGYSDITSLHMAFIAKAGLAGCIHGAMLCPDMAAKPPETTQLLLSLLSGKTYNLAPSFEVLRHGTAEGLLLGGNLAVFMSSLNTPYMPPLDGSILFFEDVGEAAHRIDRMLRTLRHMGVLSRCAGLVFGDFTEKGDDLGEHSGEEYRPFVENVFREVTEGLNIPVIFGLPSGHCTPNYPLPLGLKVRLDSSQGLLLI